MKAHLPFEWPRTGLPLVIAHRGASAGAPENTMAAFRLALEQGADGIELDVQLTADRAAVVYHDRTLKRTTGRRGRLGTIDVDALAGIDCGSWFDDSFAGERVPLLEEVLELCRDRAFVNIEMKGGRDPALVEAVIAAVRSTGMAASVLLSAFEHSLLIAAHRSAPDIARGVLVRPLDFGARSQAARRVGAQAVVMARSQLRTDRVENAHGHGLAVIAYTIDRPKEIARCRRLGVDAIITNDPAATRAALEEID